MPSTVIGRLIFRDEDGLPLAEMTGVLASSTEPPDYSECQENMEYCNSECNNSYNGQSYLCQESYEMGAQDCDFLFMDCYDTCNDDFNEKFPKKYDGLKAGNVIVYTRLSDGVKSIGSIRYFHPGEVVYATVIDLVLSNFQTARVDEIDREPSKKLLQKLWAKAEAKGRRRRRKDG